DLPRDPRGSLGFDVVAPEGVEALHEPPRRVDFQVLALGDRQARAWMNGLVARPGRPVRLGADAERVLGPHLRVCDRLPQAIGAGLDVDLEDLLHHSSSSRFLSPVSVAAQGSAYLLTQRSWTSRMGTGFRKWSFSRPRRLVVTSPASSRIRRCFMTPMRDIGIRRSNAVSVWPSSS